MCQIYLLLLLISLIRRYPIWMSVKSWERLLSVTNTSGSNSTPERSESNAPGNQNRASFTECFSIWSGKRGVTPSFFSYNSALNLWKWPKCVRNIAGERREDFRIFETLSILARWWLAPTPLWRTANDRNVSFIIFLQWQFNPYHLV